MFGVIVETVQHLKRVEVNDQNVIFLRTFRAIVPSAILLYFCNILIGIVQTKSLKNYTLFYTA